MRKIKLMALLLAALMVVTAFAGCAGVKKEELDALDVRVQALEDLLNGQQKDLEDIKNQLAENGNNSEILDAIESIKTDLEDKIKDVNDRVDDVDGKADATVGVVSDATKTAQQKALASIEVKRAAFTKNVAKYSEENFEKISEALGTATGAVNAATTTEAVDKALAALDAELVKYLTYQDMAYKYYVDLLGNVNADAADLVAEAKAFLKEVKAVYDEPVKVTGTVDGNSPYEDYAIAGYEAELLHFVSEGTSDARDQYINVYNAVYSLCELYTGSVTDTKDIYFENAKGKVDVVNLKSVAGYKKDAEDLIERIAQALGEELVYSEDNNSGFKKVSSVFRSYETYVEGAEFLGGQKLVDLVTNAADIVKAEETVKLLEEAAEEFGKAIRVSAAGTADPFYYYDRLDQVWDGTDAAIAATGTSAKKLLEANLFKDIAKGLANRRSVWIADEYEKVEDALADWVADFELSDANKLAIIAWKKSATAGSANYDYYGRSTTTGNSSYLANKLTNDLLVAAYNNFKTEIAETIIEANAISSANVTMVQLYEEVEDKYGDFFKLQSKPASVATAKHPENLDIYIDGGNNYAFTNPTIAAQNMMVIIRDSGIFEEYAEERLEILFDADATNKDGVIANYKNPRNITLLDLYTFASDKATLELDRITYSNIYFNAVDDDNNPATYLKVTDNRANGKIYTFFLNEYPAIDAAADFINAAIKTLDETLVISDNEAYITLEGKYVKLPTGGTITVAGTTFAAAQNKYFPVAMVYLKEYVTGSTTTTYFDNYVNAMKYDSARNPGARAITIEGFKHHYPDFVALLDLDIFEADKAEKAALLDQLFTEGLAIVDALDVIPYVRLSTVGTANTVWLFDDANENGIFDYVDANGNGKYDAGETTTENPVAATSANVPYLVNLSQKAAVTALWDRLVSWRKLGGNHEMKKFTNYVDAYGTVYADVYEMQGFKNADQVKVEFAGKMIEELYLQIEKLLAMVTNYKNLVALIEKAHAANAFTATLNSDNTYGGTLYRAAGTNGVNEYAWISYSEKQVANAYEVWEGSWTGIGTNNTTQSFDTRNYADTATNTVKSLLVTKAGALDNAVTLYDAFVAANVQYVGDPSNDYVTTTGVTLYYVNPEYVEYDEFEKVVDSYAKFDLIAIKALLLSARATGTASLTAHDLTFVQSIYGAETMEQIEALIISHNAENASDRITFASVDTHTIYEFEALSSIVYTTVTP